jgi:hypothetical protein
MHQANMLFKNSTNSMHREETIAAAQKEPAGKAGCKRLEPCSERRTRRRRHRDGLRGPVLHIIVPGSSGVNLFLFFIACGSVKSPKSHISLCYVFSLRVRTGGSFGRAGSLRRPPPLPPPPSAIPHSLWHTTPVLGCTAVQPLKIINLVQCTADHISR